MESMTAQDERGGYRGSRRAGGPRSHTTFLYDQQVTESDGCQSRSESERSGVCRMADSPAQVPYYWVERVAAPEMCAVIARQRVCFL